MFSKEYVDDKEDEELAGVAYSGSSWEEVFQEI